MSNNKSTVQHYMDGFNEGDHGKILSCLNENVVWEMPGYFHLTGKEAFDKEIENENFVGRPVVEVFRMSEENNVVIAEGSVQCQMKNGGMLDAVFCDVFEMEGGKISKLISYVVSKKASGNS